MITTKSQSSRTSSNRIISRAESPLTSRKSGSTVSSPFGSSQLSARSSFGLSNASKKPLPPLDEEEIHSDARIAPILIVDDEPYVADLLYHWVSNVWDYPAIIARDGESAIMAMREHHPRMVLLDVHLPDLNGIDVLRALKSADEFLPVVMVSAEESITTAVESLKAGGYDYLTKPINTDRLQVIIRNALATYSYHEKLRQLQRELNHRYDFSNIISADPRMHDVFKFMRKACDSEINVCILGESGTGKELVARAIHTNGPRSDKPFQVINCAAIPHALLESELFGHEKGSFTGATQRKIGKFEAANGGTLFLDEIGDMDLMLQSKVLRAIQEHEFERVGGTETIRVDVRIICATNADLQEAIQAKRFREDLYYRISAFPIMLPPLRERRGDILLLAESFLQRASERQGKRVSTISRAAMEAMIAYPWPGNIREIESMIERAVILADGDTINVRDLPLPVRQYGEVPEGEESAEDMKEFFDPLKNRTVLPLEEVKRIVVHHALSACRGNISEAAQKLDISRSTMYRFLEIYNIETKNGLALLDGLQQSNEVAAMAA
jgi:two-component system, NtrC family, response regulator AtoC